MLLELRRRYEYSKFKIVLSNRIFRFVELCGESIVVEQSEKRNTEVCEHSVNYAVEVKLHIFNGQYIEVVTCSSRELFSLFDISFRSFAIATYIVDRQ